MQTVFLLFLYPFEMEKRRHGFHDKKGSKGREWKKKKIREKDNEERKRGN